MVPTIQVPVAYTFNILKNILKKHTNTNRILKKKKKKMPSKENYDQIKADLNNKPFL